MKYNSIGKAIAGAIDQAQRGMTDHEYELHLRRLHDYAERIFDLEDKIAILADEEGSDRYIKAQEALAKYQKKLSDEEQRGLA